MGLDGLWMMMRWHLADGRFRSARTIAEHSGYSLQTVRTTLQEMERRGEVEVRRGYRNAHGNAKVYRVAR